MVLRSLSQFVMNRLLRSDANTSASQGSKSSSNSQTAAEMQRLNRYFEEEQDSDSDDNVEELQSASAPRWRQSDKRRRWIIPVAAIQLLILFILLVYAAIRFDVFGGPRLQKPTLVVASYKAQDVSWLADVPESWDVHRYCGDCKKRKPFKDKFGTALPVPFKLGREAMAYLTWLIDHHKDPPPYTVFVHGHNTSWHQPEDISSILRAIDFASIDAQGYIPLKCTVLSCNPSAPGLDLTQGPAAVPDGALSGALKMMPAWWKVMFDNEEEAPEDRIAPPNNHRAVGGAQFAVSRANIKEIPLSRIKRLRKPLESEKSLRKFDSLLRTVTVDTWGFYRNRTTLNEIFNGGLFTGLSSYAIGSLYEVSWGVLFGQGRKSLPCPSMDICRNVYLSGAIDCTGWLWWASSDQVLNCSINAPNMAIAEAKNKAILEELNSEE